MLVLKTIKICDCLRDNLYSNKIIDSFISLVVFYIDNKKPYLAAESCDFKDCKDCELFDVIINHLENCNLINIQEINEKYINIIPRNIHVMKDCYYLCKCSKHRLLIDA